MTRMGLEWFLSWVLMLNKNERPVNASVTDGRRKAEKPQGVNGIDHSIVIVV